MLHRILSFIFLGILVVTALRAQQAAPPFTPAPPVRDPNALALAVKSLQALAGGTALQDVTLQASATYIAGSDQESGTATLVALACSAPTCRGGSSSARVTLDFTSGQRQEIRNGPAGAWSGPDGTAHSMATHNCWTDASWFFPAFTLAAAAADGQTAVSYLGSDASKGRPLLHLQVAHLPAGQAASVTARILRLATMDIYLDPQSLLPLILDFNVHPDSDARTNLPVEIRFANFQNISGVLVPFRIQKYLQGALALDLVVTNAVLNSGVPNSVFMLPAAPLGGEQ